MIREGLFEGHRTFAVEQGLRIGIYLYIYIYRSIPDTFSTIYYY